MARVFWNSHHGCSRHLWTFLPTYTRLTSLVPSAVLARLGHLDLTWVTEPTTDTWLLWAALSAAGLSLAGGLNGDHVKVGPLGRPCWTTRADRKEVRREGEGKRRRQDAETGWLSRQPRLHAQILWNDPFILVINSTSAYYSYSEMHF